MFSLQLASLTRALLRLRFLGLASLLPLQSWAVIHPAPSVSAAADSFPSSWPGSNAVDQSPNEYLSNFQGTATYLEFDFGTERTVDGYVNVTTTDIQRRTETCRLIFDTDGIAGFNATTDTVRNFTSAQTGTQGQGYVNRFAAVTARKIRWEVLTSSGNDTRLGTTEIAFLNTNAGSTPITGVTVIGSATAFSAQFAASNAANGIAGIGYLSGVEYASAGQGSNTYVDFDLGAARPVTGFDLFDRLGAVDRMTSFDLIFSNNADFSAPLATRSYSKSATWTASDNFAAITARYVRLDVTAAGPGANAGVGDITFYQASINQAPSFALPAPTQIPPGATWTSKSAAPAVTWTSVAASGDGTKLLATAFDGQPYVSTNSGVTWTKRIFNAPGVPSNIELGQRWSSSAMAADGSVIFVTSRDSFGGYVLSSTDLGATWVIRDNTNSSGGWASISCSADGTKVFGARSTGSLFTSTDSGQTFTARLTDATRLWSDVASSADGVKLVAVENGGQIWTSTDSGVSWIARPSAGSRSWTAVASSADGVRLAAVVSGGKIFVSADSGVTWTERLSDANRSWSDVAISADGTRQAATISGGQVWLSSDSGVTWAISSASTSSNWNGIAYNRTGTANFLAAVSSAGPLHTSVGTTAPYTVTATPGSAAVSVFNFATAISAGSGDTGQTVAFIVSNSNNALFSVPPAIDASGTLTFRPALLTGSATITVVAQDNGGTANGGVDSSATQTFVISIPVDTAGTWSTGSWLNDSSTGILSGQTIWARNFGGSTVTINGVSVPGLTTVPASETHFEFTGPNQLFSGDTNDLTSGSGGSASLAQTFLWNGYDTTLTLKNLTVGQSYVFTLLTVGWEATTGTRLANFGSGSDVLAVDQNLLGDNKGLRVEYAFTASATTRVIKIASTTPTASIHMYGAALRIGGASTNQAPTNIGLTNSAIAENNAPGATVGALSATDADTSQTHTYELVSGTGSTDNAAFSISGSNLVITGSANFEAKSSYSIRVRATDNGFPSQSFEKVFTLSVTDFNEPPTDLVLSNASLAEHSPIYTDIGTLAAIGDPDTTFFNWTFVSGTGSTDNDSFRIIGGTTLQNLVVPSLATKTSYSIRLRASASGDPASFLEKVFTITVTNVNDAPVVSAITARTINEDQSTGAISFTVSDAETAVGSLVVTASSSNPALVPSSAIAVGGSGANRTVTITPAANLNGTATITVSANDGLATGVSTFLLTVNAVNDAPSFTLAGSPKLPISGYVNTLAFQTTGVVTTSSPGAEESGQSVSFVVTNDNTNLFGIQPALDASGTLSFSPSGLDGTATVTVRAQDNGGTANGGVDTSAAQTFTITIIAPRAPTDITLSNATVPENSPAGTVVGTLGVADLNPTETHTYALVSGSGSADNGFFTVSGTSLVLNTVPNAEVKHLYTLRLRVTDSGTPANSFEKAFTVTISNVNDEPRAITPDRTSFAENRGPGEVAASLSVTDDDAGQTHTLALVSGAGSDDNAAFTLNGTDLVAVNNADYETKSSYSIRVRATDNGSPALSIEQVLVLAVVNANDTPTDIVLSRTSFPEDFRAGPSTTRTVLGTLSATDPDAGSTFTFAVARTNGTDENDSFTIENGNQLVLNTVFDYEKRQSWRARLAVTDNGVGAYAKKSFVKEIVISVTDVDEPLLADDVSATQRDGSKKVDISYYMVDPDAGATTPVSIALSSDGGNTWSLPVTSATGDIGSAVKPHQIDYVDRYFGDNRAKALRSITWDGAANWNEQNSAAMRVRVTAGSTVLTTPNFAVDTRGDGNVTITGRVISKSTKLPLAGVTLRTGSRTVTTAADGTFRINNAANGLLNVSLNQYLPVSRDIAAGSRALSVNTGDIALRPDTTDPVVDEIKPDVTGMIIAGFKVTTPIRVKVEWGNGTPGQVIVKRQATPNSTPVTIATLTGAGPNYVTPAIDIDGNFPASFDPRNNKIIVEAVNSLGVRSAAETIGLSIIPLPAQIAKRMPADAEAGDIQFPPAQVAGQPTKPLNHIGFDYGAIEEEMAVTVPQIGKWGFSFGAEGSFDFTMSDGNWENAFVVGDIALFGGQFRQAKRFTRPGNAFDIDGDRPSLELYLGDKTISGSVVAREFGSASATTGLKLGSMQAALAVHFEDKLGEMYTVDIVPPLRALPKKIKKIFGNIALYGTVGLNGSGTIAVDPAPKIIEGTVGGAVGLKAALELDFWVADASVYIGGIANVTIGMPAPILRDAGIRFFAGYEINSWFYDSKGEVTIGEWRYTASPATRGVVLSGPIVWSPMERTWRARGAESFLQDSGVTVTRTTKGTVSSAPTRISSELAAFNSFGSTRSTRLIPSDPDLPAQAALPLLDNVFPKAKPSLAEHDGKLMLAYVRDTGAANPVQFTEVAYTYYDGTTWSFPGPIDADPRGQLEPQVAFDGNGDAVAVWARLKDPAFAGTGGPEEMAPLLELVTARWDATTRTWSPSTALTDNAILDHKPILSGPLTDGDLLLGWVRNAGNEIGGTGAPGDLTNDQLLVARWDAATDTWGAPTVVNSTLTNNQTVSFAAQGAKAAFVWTQDLDGELDTAADTELYSQVWNGTAWSPATRVTNDSVSDRPAQVAVDSNGNVYTLWVSGTDLVMQANFTGPRSLVRADSGDSGFSDTTLTVADNGRVLALWQAMSVTGPDAFFRVYDPVSATWGLDDQLSHDSAMEKSFSAVWDSLGNLVIAYNNVELIETTQTVTLSDGTSEAIEGVITPGRNDLFVARRRIITDLGFVADGIALLTDSFLPGAVSSLQAKIKNTGNLAVEDVEVAFYLGDPAAGGTLIGSSVIDGWLRSTEERVVEQSWTIPAGLTAAVKIYAVVDPLGALAEFVETNNQLVLDVAPQDLQLQYLGGSVLRDGTFSVRARVLNTGATLSPVTDLRLWDDLTETTGPIAIQPVSRLEPGQTVDVTINMPVGFFGGIDQSYRLVLNTAARESEIEPGDNQSDFTLTLFIDDDGDGLPLQWEQDNFLSDTNAADALLDSDGDGFNNRAEYLSGTDPWDRASFLKVGQFNVQTLPGSAGRIFTITWASAAGKTYAVERSTDLTTWTTISEGIPATAPVNTFSDDPLNLPRVFYRIRPQ